MCRLFLSRNIEAPPVQVSSSQAAARPPVFSIRAPEASAPGRRWELPQLSAAQQFAATFAQLLMAGSAAVRRRRRRRPTTEAEDWLCSPRLRMLEGVAATMPWVCVEAAGRVSAAGPWAANHMSIYLALLRRLSAAVSERVLERPHRRHGLVAYLAERVCVSALR
jgi:hypothetical protein